MTRGGPPSPRQAVELPVAGEVEQDRERVVIGVDDHAVAEVVVADGAAELRVGARPRCRYRRRSCHSGRTVGCRAGRSRRGGTATGSLSCRRSGRPSPVACGRHPAGRRGWRRSQTDHLVHGRRGDPAGGAVGDLDRALVLERAEDLAELRPSHRAELGRRVDGDRLEGTRARPRRRPAARRRARSADAAEEAPVTTALVRRDQHGVRGLAVRRARPTSCRYESRDSGGSAWTTNRTWATSMPIPNAVVATTSIGSGGSRTVRGPAAAARRQPRVVRSCRPRLGAEPGRELLARRSGPA